MHKKIVVLKLTGEILKTTEKGIDALLLESIAKQIKELLGTIRFGLVMGGGNFFRGSIHSEDAHISEKVGHNVGMLATMMNGLIIQDVFERHNISTTLFSALECESVGLALSPQNISQALQKKDCLIFVGGTANPFFTTDTTAVVRALQIDAKELWKATKVDGVYTSDPEKHPAAALLKTVTYRKAIDDELNVMDSAAFALADQYKIQTRVFNVFLENALIKVATDASFGSTIVASH